MLVQLGRVARSIALKFTKGKTLFGVECAHPTRFPKSRPSPFEFRCALRPKPLALLSLFPILLPPMRSRPPTLRRRHALPPDRAGHQIQSASVSLVSGRPPPSRDRDAATASSPLQSHSCTTTPRTSMESLPAGGPMPCCPRRQLRGSDGRPSHRSSRGDIVVGGDDPGGVVMSLAAGRRQELPLDAS
jgi:hypothetical protein